MTNTEQRSIVQCVREIGPGGGVCGVAWALDRAFRRRGQAAESFTINSLGLSRAIDDKHRNLYIKKLVLLFDIVIYTMIGSLVGWLRFRDRPVICHNDTLFGQVYINHGLHRGMLDASGHKWRMFLRNPLHLFMWVRDAVRFGLNLHDHYVCFSASEGELLTRYFPKTRSRIVIIPNGVDLERFRPNAVARREVRAELGLSAEQFILVFVGHEYERKGLLSAIHALRLLDARVRLLVAGGTNEEMKKGRAAARVAGVEDRVQFLGVVAATERILAASDCLILPSSFEAWPLVGLEAMACGLPTLMTAVGGVPDFLKDGLNGYFITRSPDEIARKITTLLEEPATLERMRQHSLETAAAYSWEQIAGRYLDLFDSIPPAPVHQPSGAR